jgi:hypothetical protein
MVLIMYLEVSEEEYRKERSEEYKTAWAKHALEGCKVTGKSGKLIPCLKKNCGTCEDQVGEDAVTEEEDQLSSSIE